MPLWLLIACGKNDGDSAEPRQDIVLDTSIPPVDTFHIPTDTADTEPYPNLSPNHTLSVSYAGRWTLDGAPGAWTGMTGRLEVVNLLDGDTLEPYCDWVYDLTATPLTASCPDCSVHMDVHFALRPPEDLDLDPKDPTPYETGIGTCEPHDLPVDGEDWEMGWSDLDDFIWLNLDKTGIWVPQYLALGVGAENEIVFLSEDNTRNWPFFYQDTGL